MIVKREINTVSELHHHEGHNDDYDNASDEHDLNKWLCPSTFTGGRDERERESRAIYLQAMHQDDPERQNI